MSDREAQLQARLEQQEAELSAAREKIHVLQMEIRSLRRSCLRNRLISAAIAFRFSFHENLMSIFPTTDHVLPGTATIDVDRSNAHFLEPLLEFIGNELSSVVAADVLGGASFEPSLRPARGSV